MSVPPQIHELRWYQRLAVIAGAILVRVWLATVRVRITEASRTVLSAQDRPVMFLLWHNQLLLAPRIHWEFRPDAPVSGLVSASKDGAWLTALFRALDIGAIRGSSSRFGREALHSIVACLRNGRDAAITPDGPRGPAYSFEAGAIVAARRAEVPLMLVGAEFHRAWRVDAWDGFFIPKPFSVVTLRAELVEPCEVRERSQVAEDIAARLRALSAENEKRFPAPPRMLRKMAAKPGSSK